MTSVTERDLAPTFPQAPRLGALPVRGPHRLPFVTLLLLLGGCATTTSTPRVRPTTWAQPVIGTDVDNLFQVSPVLYRCAQPSKAQFGALEAFGIAAVVNLREYHGDADEVEGCRLELAEVPLDAGGVTYAQLVLAVRALVAAKKPVVVHCWHGSDRTGAVVAAWRVAVDGWTPEEALAEMTAGGFGHAAMFANLRALIAGLDPARLRADVGLPHGH